MRLPLIAALLSLAPLLHSQSLFGVAGAGTAYEFTGTMQTSCSPNGPNPLLSFAYTQAFSCTPPQPFAPAPNGMLGDITVDRIQDLVWVTDGANFGEYNAQGNMVSAFAIPPGSIPGFGPVLGLGMDAPANLLWITDGRQAAAVMPPPAPGCLPFTLVVPPFMILPVGVIYTDIDWDSSTNSLIACANANLVVSFMIGGGAGPFGIYSPGTCALSPTLQGIAFDAGAAAGSGAVFITDGFAVSHELPPGFPAPPSFAVATPCIVPPGPPLSGLAYAARPLGYGSAYPFGMNRLRAFGQSISPNANFALRLTSAQPGTLALFYYNSTFLCPTLFLPYTVNIGLTPPPIYLGSAIVNASGNAQLPAPLPAFLPIPGTVFVQAFIVGGGPPIQSSNGLEVSFARP